MDARSVRHNSHKQPLVHTQTCRYPPNARLTGNTNRDEGLCSLFEVDGGDGVEIYACHMGDANGAEPIMGEVAEWEGRVVGESGTTLAEGLRFW